MKIKLIHAVIHWVEVVTAAILYQSNIFPEQHRIDLHKAMTDLVKELKEEAKQ